MLLSAPSDTLTRPNDTTAYSTGDLIANSTTAGSVVPLTFKVWSTGQGQTIIQRIRIAKSQNSTSNSQFRVHFYQVSPTAANGDNGAFSTNKFDGYLGNVDVTAFFAFTDGASGFGAAPAGGEMRLRLASGTTLYGLIEARAAYAPAANETFTVTLECLDGY